MSDDPYRSPGKVSNGFVLLDDGSVVRLSEVVSVIAFETRAKEKYNKWTVRMRGGEQWYCSDDVAKLLREALLGG